MKCADRLLSHRRKFWDGKDLEFSFYSVERTIFPHQLKELENDLIGNFFRAIPESVGVPVPEQHVKTQIFSKTYFNKY